MDKDMILQEKEAEVGQLSIHIPHHLPLTLPLYCMLPFKYHYFEQPTHITSYSLTLTWTAVSLFHVEGVFSQVVSVLSFGINVMFICSVQLRRMQEMITKMQAQMQIKPDGAGDGQHV